MYVIRTTSGPAWVDCSLVKCIKKAENENLWDVDGLLVTRDEMRRTHEFFAISKKQLDKMEEALFVEEGQEFN
jgi:hypothetical protein